MKNKHPRLLAIVICISIILFAYLFEYLKINIINNLVSNVLYLGIIGYWTQSIYFRVIQKQTKRMLITIGVLFLFWGTCMTLKYCLDLGEFARYLWYLYYLGICFIPSFILLTALSVGKYEKYKLPKWTTIFLVCSTILFLLVMTNDLHELVFDFKGDFSTGNSDTYVHGIVYYIICAYAMLCILGGIGIILHKGRSLKTKRTTIGLLVSIIILVVYLVCTVLFDDFIHKIHIYKFTIVTAFISIAIFEMLLFSQLIQNNTRYDQFFYMSGIEFKIYDNNKKEYLNSPYFKDVPEDLIFASFNSPVIVDDNYRISSKKIKDGYVVYKEDVSQLLSINNEIKEDNEELENYNSLLNKEIEQKDNLYRLEERNRLYDAIQNETKTQVQKLSVLFSKLEVEKNKEVANDILKDIIVIGAYVKRIDNLILNHNGGYISNIELQASFNEIVKDLNDVGITSSITYDLKDQEPSNIIELFIFFGAVIEEGLHSLTKAHIYVESKSIRIIAKLDKEITLSSFEDAIVSSDEDGIYEIELTLKEDK